MDLDVINVDSYLLKPLLPISVGGTPDSQREFLDTLSSDPTDPRLPNERRKGRVAPIANEFALGYTYQDVLDADHEGTHATAIF
jgi:dynein light intermediate chain 1